MNIYIIQERTIPKHVQAFDLLCADRQLKPRYHQFSMARPVLAALFKKDFSRLRVELSRVIEMLVLIPRLVFGPRALVILGIAPFDVRMALLAPVLLRHSVYLHNSWPSWGPGEPIPKSLFLRFSKPVWKIFVPNFIKGIFCVSETTARSISINFPTWPPRAVVGHTIDISWFVGKAHVKAKNWNRSIAYVGRMVEEKGLDDLLVLARNLPEFQFHFIGDGPMEKTALKAGLNNVFCHGYVGDRAELMSLLDACDIVAQPSRPSSTWVEAFGLGVLEGMARGLIPITTDTPGSLEVLGSDLAFLSCPEEDYTEHFVHIVKSLNGEKAYKLRSQCAQRATYFSPSSVSERWEKLLDMNDE